MSRTETRPGPVDELRLAHARAHVVTVTHNNLTTLDAYFAGLDASADGILGVTIVDNASTDGTAERLETEAGRHRFPVVVVRNRNAGFAGGYAAAATGRFPDQVPTLCVNPDVSLARKALPAMLQVLEDFPDTAVVTVPLVELDGTPDSASRRKLPTLSGSVVYSVLGRLTPKRLRYNRQRTDRSEVLLTRTGVPTTIVQATTGALMLVRPEFRTLGGGIFDRDYFMYGEDLQLCADAAAAGMRVRVAEVTPSVHVKGVSSGRPRSRPSNRAFHDAMTIYLAKNLVRHPVAVAVLRIGVELHFLISEVRAVPARRRRRAEARNA